MSILEVKGVSKSFRGLRALTDLNMSISEGEIVGLVGPNGAGKTTAFNVISGVMPATRGEITVMGKRTGKLRPHEIVKLGLSRTFQATNVFKGETVIENVLRGLLVSHGIRFYGALFNTSTYRKQSHAMRSRALDILDMVGLGDSADNLSTSLPYGHQRLLGVAIALAGKPRVLLLDEPAAGLNPAEAQIMAEMITRIHTQLNVSVLLVEHNMRMVMGLCQRLVVLKHGEMIAQGTPQQIRNNPHVISAYLGSDDNETA